MRLIFLLVIFLFLDYNCFSQTNLPDWIAARPSPANVGYMASIVIPTTWPTDPFNEIPTGISSSSGDSQDNIIIEVYDNQIPRQIRNTISASGTYGVNPSIGSGVMHNDSLVYKAISQIGNNDCATTSGKDELYVDDGTNVFLGIKCVGTNSAMPITYSKTLEATQKQNSTILTWSVATQINNDKYIIEHSIEGGNFSPIGEIEGDGTSNITKHYEYIHTLPSLGINYYRIKQLDYDGKYSYSDIASVRYDGSGETNIYPNPATSEVTITTTEPTSVQVMDVYGRLLINRDISDGQNTLNISALPSGILIFVVGDQRYKVLKE